jgi:hypothetical protein
VPGTAPAAALNAALAFVLEIALVWAVARVGFAMAPQGLARWLLALAAAAIVVPIWGWFAAPKSNRRLAGFALLAFKSAMFTLGALAFAITAGPGVAGLYAGAAALHLVVSVRSGTL